MPRWISTVVAIAVTSLIACTGDVLIGDPDLEVAHLALGADSLGALQAEACIQLRGPQVCPTYPNPQACERLRVSVRGDGSTVGTCAIEGQAARTLRGVGEGIPLMCRMDYDSGCIQCADIYGGAVVDTCGESEIFGGQGWLSDDTGTPVAPGSGPLTEPDGTPAPGSGAAQCDQQAQKSFVDKLNALLAGEGFTFSWSPDLSKLQPGGGLLGDSDFHIGDLVCPGLGAVGQNAPACDLGAKAEGRCYCEQSALLGVRCRCARMTAAVLARSCAAIPAGCDAVRWGVAILKIYGAASQWLIGANVIGYGVPAIGGPKTIGGVEGPQNITCLGSPLLLDLEGDGVALGPVERGVHFDLFGSGPVRTAWVDGDDDALLALDRDGDGRITSGAELFGEGSTLDGRLADDGFQALSVLDRPDHGGNANGLVEPGDLMFDQLVLWTDANHDGVSQPGELRPLEDAGVAGLELSATSAERVIDESGNDLSLRARFLRRGGGSGLLVDALLTQ